MPPCYWDVSTPVPNEAADLDPGPVQHRWALLGPHSLAPFHLGGAFAYAETFWLQEWKCGLMELAQTAPEREWKSLLQARGGQLLHQYQPCYGKGCFFTLVLTWPCCCQESCLNISALWSHSLELDFPVIQYIPAHTSLCAGGNCIPLCGLLSLVDTWESSQSVGQGSIFPSIYTDGSKVIQTIGKVYCALPT